MHFLRCKNGQPHTHTRIQAHTHTPTHRTHTQGDVGDDVIKDCVTKDGDNDVTLTFSEKKLQ